MCGILGSVNIPFDEALLDLIRHRGPDDHGMASVRVNEHVITFGQRRLAIVDLSEAGHQPMTPGGGECCLVFNGEIYNHLDLRRSLPGSVRFRGHSDTETVLQYLMEFGPGSIARFNGIFAFAFLDARNGRLYLARDRFGVKPLYYAFSGNRLFFASELRPIVRELEPEVNPGALGNSLMMRYFPAPLTPYKGVHKVEPGQLITIDLAQDGLCLAKSYFLEKPRSLGRRRDEQSHLVRIYGDLFEKAVSRQLMADVDIGILLSGGIDSALVAAVAQQRSPRKLKAFTVGFADALPAVDETEAARETAAILGLEHYTRDCSYREFMASVKKISGIVEEPLATTSIVPMFFLSELASSHVKVVLSGQGADEPLGGYDKYKGLGILAASRKLKPVSDIVRFTEPFYGHNEKYRRLFSSVLADDLVSSYLTYNSILSFGNTTRLFREEYLNAVRATRNEYCEQLKNRAPGNSRLAETFLYHDLRTSLSDDLLMYTDKITMHFGLECRVPILDNDLIEFLESLHVKYKFNFRDGKIIHKAFAREYLPASIISRRKLGFKSPTEAWFMKKDELIDMIGSCPGIGRFFSVERITDMIRSHSCRNNLEKQLFLLLTISHFLARNWKTERASLAVHP